MTLIISPTHGVKKGRVGNIGPRRGCGGTAYLHSNLSKHSIFSADGGFPILEIICCALWVSFFSCPQVGGSIPVVDDRSGGAVAACEEEIKLLHFLHDFFCLLLLLGSCRGFLVEGSNKSVWDPDWGLCSLWKNTCVSSSPGD